MLLWRSCSLHGLIWLPVFLAVIGNCSWNQWFPSGTMVSGFFLKHASQRLPSRQFDRRAVGRVQRRRGEVAMCICINCSRVINCSAYHFVETKHNQPHIAATTTFTPRDGSPTIHVNVRTDRTNTDKEVNRMWREHEEETARAQQAQTGDDPLHGETVYNLTPVTTMEYDVVACADYVEDVGCWVRNMPEEIKRANPHFVPT